MTKTISQDENGDLFLDERGNLAVATEGEGVRQQVTSAVRLWQGEKDGSVPLAMGKAIAARIPKCIPTFIPNEGHFWLFENIGLLLKQLLGLE